MQQDKEFFYRETLPYTAEMYRRCKRNSLIMAVFFSVLSVGIIYWPLTHNLSAWVSGVLCFLAAIAVYISMDHVFDAGRYCAIQYYDPELLKAKRQYQELKDEFNEHKVATLKQEDRHFNEHFALRAFLKGRSPGLFSEFTKWKQEQLLSLLEQKEEQGEN